MLWDHLLTFKEEIECIWKLPMEFSKVVFLFNRYFVAGSLCCSVYSEFASFSDHTGDLTPRLQYCLNCVDHCPKR